MKALQKIWNGFLSIFGIRKNSKYVKNYLNEANMKSAAYMSLVIFVLEIWLIIRQLDKYVIKRILDPNKLAQYIYGPFHVFHFHTADFWLLMLFGITMFLYCIFYLRKTAKSRLLIPTLVVAGITALLCCLLPMTITFTNAYYAKKGIDPLSGFNLVMLLAYYISVFLFAVSIAVAAIYKHRGGRSPIILSVLVISLFALTCLVFGVRTSYVDFSSATTNAEGQIIPNPDYKGIICFLMFSIYIGCLLIWKPYISIGILGSVFLGFYFVLESVTIRKFSEGDQVNYITFFISLTMICVSIYNQRISEANKDEELEELATQDKITGLLSFEYFNVLAKDKMLEGDLGSGDGIYLFINIIGFKIYNDKKGFEEGNIFLKETGEIIKQVFDDALVSRQSDDHFVVFSKKINIEEKLNRVNSLVEAKDPEVRLGIKAGGNITVQSEENPRICVEKARYAYDFLKNNKSTKLIVYYDEKMHDQYLLTQYIVTHIEEAIENGYLKPYYQPVVWSKGRTLCGVEALARWIDPNHGFLSPGTFIPALENAHLVYKLDKEILRLVCQDIRHNLDNDISVLPVSINFSRADFGLIDIVEVVESTVEEFKIPHELLHIEITESALTNETDTLKDTINRLHKKGFATWLDDFGSGYSSFNVLKDYDFDVLKLDMAFLIGFNGNEKAKSLIRSVISMADQIGMKTLCEGVETAEQAAFLEEACCGRLQGFLYGKPLSYEELFDRINKGEYHLSKELIN